MSIFHTQMVEEPFSVMNYSVIWWIVISVFFVIMAGFYILTFQLTRPLKGENDDIFIRKVNGALRREFLNEIEAVHLGVTDSKLTLDEAVSELASISQRFIAAKSMTELKSVTLQELKDGKAPQPVIDIYEEIYALKYRRDLSNKAVPFFSLMDRVRSMVSLWK